MSGVIRTLAIGFALFAAAQATEARASILPENNLAEQDSFAPANVTEEQFNKITDGIIEMWKPLAKIYGAELVADKNWNDSTVNAYASQSGNVWHVSMFGGLARRPEITPDGFALVVCHELGHHFGGYSFKGGRWAAAEGQADYFATQVCARRIWAKSAEKNKQLADRRPTQLQHACDNVWTNEDERNLCYRSTEAGISLSHMLGALGGEIKPTLESRDKVEVSTTNENHPHAQCRLDTYLHGALCTQAFDVRVIPGKSIGRNTPEAEIEAAKYSCMQAANFKVGYRPRCWFKPLNASFTGGRGGDDDDFGAAMLGWR